MKEAVSVGTLGAEHGSERCGFLKVGNRPDGSPLGIPVTIINGSQDGTTLCVDACSHGDELESAEAVMRVRRLIDPKKLREVFIGVPLVNVPAYEAMQRKVPFDIYNYSDLNRNYPGVSEGSRTERIVFLYFNNVVSKADYAITLHMHAWKEPLTIR